MPKDEDKYPTESGRRRFVKGVVGGAALAGIGTGSAAALNTATSPTGAGGGITKFFGIKNTSGPAPRGMPQIPLEIDDEGYLKGIWPKVQQIEEGGRTITVAKSEIAGYTYTSEAFQYCGVQTYSGVQPDADQDNYLRSAANPPYQWQADAYSEGDRFHVDDFANYEQWGNGIGRAGIGKPATGKWRSEGLQPQETMPIQVLRSERVKEMAGGDSDFADWVDATTQEGFIAWLNKCTHFCCVPSFKGIPGSAKFNAENEVYCPCHQSVYDPFDIVQKSFVALPRPE